MKLNNLPSPQNYVHVYLWDNHELIFKNTLTDSEKTIDQLISIGIKECNLGELINTIPIKLHGYKYNAIIFEDGALITREKGYPTIEETHELLTSIESLLFHL